MATAAIFGKGTLLQVDRGGGFVTLAEVKTISGPTFEAEEVEVTNHDSPGDFREFIRGLVDAGELTFDVNFQPNAATHVDLFADLKSGAVWDYKILWAQMTPTQYQMDFTAFVRSMPIDSPVDNVLSASLTLRVTGEPTISAV